jgi:ParB-like chromosome segregation protein Spo0J
MTKQMSIRELATGRIDNWKIDPRIIKMKPGWNVRDDTPELQEHIETIARSILSRGYDTTKPLTVWKDDAGYTLSDGHCRLRATLLAIKWGATILAVPVVCEPQATNEADRVVGMLTRNSGMNLTPLEQGKVYKRLLGFGWDEKQIMDATGKSKSHVQHIFSLMEASPETHQQVINGKVSASVVASAVREHGPAKAAKVVNRAVKSASENGKTKATARDVRAASVGEEATKARPLSEIIEFFRATVVEQDGPPGVQKIAEAFLDYREGKTTPEKFMAQLGKIVGAELVEA